MVGVKKRLLLILVMIAFLTGCSTLIDIRSEVKANKSLSYSIYSEFDKEALSKFNCALLKSAKQESECRPYTDNELRKLVAAYVRSFKETNKGFSGTYSYGDITKITFTKIINNIDSVTGEGTPFDIINDVTFDNKMFKKDGENYVATLAPVKAPTMDVTSEGFASLLNLAGLQIEESEMTSYKRNFQITLPNKSISNNADEVSDDGRTLKWDLQKDTNIEFTFKFDGTVPASTPSGTPEATTEFVDDGVIEEFVPESTVDMKFIFTLGGVIGAIVFILIIIGILQSKKNKNATEEQINPNEEKFMEPKEEVHYSGEVKTSIDVQSTPTNNMSFGAILGGVDDTPSESMSFGSIMGQASEVEIKQEQTMPVQEEVETLDVISVPEPPVTSEVITNDVIPTQQSPEVTEVVTEENHIQDLNNDFSSIAFSSVATEDTNQNNN